jgi:UDP-N-acetyl-D-galactosamine dehydrogenase
LLIAANRPVKGATVGILGITFKENVPDLRNSRVPDIVAELGEYGIEPLIADPLADPAGVEHEYALTLVPFEKLGNLDGLILAVPHRAYGDAGWEKLFAMLAPGGVFIDVKSAVSRDIVPPGIRYWSL